VNRISPFKCGRIAVSGESAGGNLAASVSMTARYNGMDKPIREVLVYPFAGYNFNTPSPRKVIVPTRNCTSAKTFHFSESFCIWERKNDALFSVV
jgi:acetyl esterase/lipase